MSPSATCGSRAMSLLPARSLVRKALYVAFGSVRQFERTGGRPLVAARTYSKIPGRARSAGAGPEGPRAVEPATPARASSARPQNAATATAGSVSSASAAGRAAASATSSQAGSARPAALRPANARASTDRRPSRGVRADSGRASGGRPQTESGPGTGKRESQ